MFQSNHIQGLAHIIKCLVKAKTGREKIMASGPLLPTVRSETVRGETEGNMSNSSGERCWVYTDSQCLSKSLMITWQTYMCVWMDV